MRESIELIAAAGAEPCGVIIALDRQERGQGELSAAQEVHQEYGLPCVAIAGLDDLLQYVTSANPKDIDIDALHAYRARYGA